MEYKNGFYVYRPKEDVNYIGELSVVQIIEVIEGEIWLTGVGDSFDIDFANSVGEIGKMVMTQEGVEQ